MATNTLGVIIVVIQTVMDSCRKPLEAWRVFANAKGRSKLLTCIIAVEAGIAYHDHRCPYSTADSRLQVLITFLIYLYYQSYLTCVLITGKTPRTSSICRSSGSSSFSFGWYLPCHFKKRELLSVSAPERIISVIAVTLGFHASKQDWSSEGSSYPGLLLHDHGYERYKRWALRASTCSLSRYFL